MSDADKLAYAIKCQPLLKYADFVIMGHKELDIMMDNKEACDPSDYNKEKGQYCGMQVVVSNEDSRLALGFNIPKLNPVLIDKGLL